MSEVVPFGENGRPLARVSMGASEKVGLPNYSSVTIGPAMVTRYVEDTPESIEQGLKDCIYMCEKIIAEERQAVLESLGQNK